MNQFRILSDMPLFPMDVIDIDGSPHSHKYQMIVQADDVADGYHTMHDLYKHRMALNIALFNYLHQTAGWDSFADAMVDIKVMKAKQHHDGTMFDGYFIVMAITPHGQISYHYKLKHWDKFNIPEVEQTPKWDGHNSLDVLERLMKL